MRRGSEDELRIANFGEEERDGRWETADFGPGTEDAEDRGFRIAEFGLQTRDYSQQTADSVRGVSFVELPREVHQPPIRGPVAPFCLEPGS